MTSYNEIAKYAQFSMPNKLLSLVSIVLFSGIVVIIGLLQLSDYEPIATVNKFQIIQSNFSSQYSLVKDYEKLEVAKMQNLVPSMRNYQNYQCIDYGSYILPLRVNPISFLPEAIRRGNGDGWQIQKSGNVDVPAQQFCSFLIMEYGSNTISCGLDMYEKLGYGGYLNNLHWCKSARQLLYNLLKT
jgi:hypothetical protein